MNASLRFALGCFALVALLALPIAAPQCLHAQDQKKDDKKAVDPEIEDFLKRLPANTPPEHVEQLRKALEENRKRADELRLRQREMFQERGKFQRFNGRSGPAPQNRLGVRVQVPDDALIAQLGLAEGNGLVLAEVSEGAAAKAGFQNNDILLKLAGKDVSSTPIEFITALDAIKADTPIDAIILRDGKEQTIKGIKLPEPMPTEEPRVNPLPRRNSFNFPPAKQ